MEELTLNLPCDHRSVADVLAHCPKLRELELGAMLGHSDIMAVLPDQQHHNLTKLACNNYVFGFVMQVGGTFLSTEDIVNGYDAFLLDRMPNLEYLAASSSQFSPIDQQIMSALNRRRTTKSRERADTVVDEIEQTLFDK